MAKTVCFLGYDRNQTRLVPYIEQLGFDVSEISDPCDDLPNYDVVVSFGYRHILRKAQLETLKRPVLNLHIAYLPFNRGAHPNFWSFIESTPAGVTIHEIDEGIDTGPICFQKYVTFPVDCIDFRESQSILIAEIESLFCQHAKALIDGSYEAETQCNEGTSHRIKDLPDWVSWDMTIADAIERYCTTKSKTDS